VWVRELLCIMNGVLGKRAMKDLSARANDSAGSGYSSFAQKMMKNMGWQEGAGLGKEGQGMASYIKVKRKDDDAGLGRDKAEQAKVTNQWYFGAFESAIAAAKTLDTSMKKKLKKEKKQGKKVRQHKRNQALALPVLIRRKLYTLSPCLARHSSITCAGLAQASSVAQLTACSLFVLMP
jgi:hypothetical protein